MSLLILVLVNHTIHTNSTAWLRQHIYVSRLTPRGDLQWQRLALRIFLHRVARCFCKRALPMSRVTSRWLFWWSLQVLRLLEGDMDHFSHLTEQFISHYSKWGDGAAPKAKAHPFYSICFFFLFFFGYEGKLQSLLEGALLIMCKH